MRSAAGRTLLRAGVAALGTAALVAAVASAVAYIRGRSVAVFDARGTIGAQERDLLLVAAGLSVLVVVPVFALAITFGIRYREGNRTAKYSPHLTNSVGFEVAWWAIPTLIVAVLGVLAWRSAHTLDPYVPLNAPVKPVPVQVIALDWKWLFVYPDQDLACVNKLVIPENTPIDFELTADAPMNSFWIPQLGGQIYAMPGMATQLHLEATSAGTYPGSSANISGVGFSGMRFNTVAVSAPEFDGWVTTTRHSPALDMDRYKALARPSRDDTSICYSQPARDLFASVIAKFASPTVPSARS